MTNFELNKGFLNDPWITKPILQFILFLFIVSFTIVPIEFGSEDFSRTINPGPTPPIIISSQTNFLFQSIVKPTQ